MSYQPISSEPFTTAEFDTVEDLMSAEEVVTLLVAVVLYPGANSCLIMNNPFDEDGRFYFWIQGVGDDGESILVRALDSITAVDEEPHALNFNVAEPRPNPFNPSTVIEYTIPEETRVIIKAYTILGQQAAVIADTQKAAGRHSVTWNASDLPSGVYIVTVRSGSYFDAKKTLLLK